MEPAAGMGKLSSTGTALGRLWARPSSHGSGAKTVAEHGKRQIELSSNVILKNPVIMVPGTRALPNL